MKLSILGIGHVNSASADNMTLTTQGRNGDLFIDGSSISEVERSYEIDPMISAAMFYDRLHGQTSQMFGPRPTLFEHTRLWRVVEQKHLYRKVL